MTARRTVNTGIVAIAWLCSLVVAAAGYGASTPTKAPEGWPEQVDGRKRYDCEYGFVYARERSAVEQVRKVFATVAVDANNDGAAAPPVGLILVMDAKEKYPCEIARLREAMTKIDPNDPLGEIESILKADTKAQELGLDVTTILSLMPLPLPASALHDIVPDFPADANERVKWCIIVPTDRGIKASFKKMIDAGIEKEKPGLLERAALATMMPLIEGKMMSMFTKIRQAVLYQLVLGVPKNLSREQMQAKCEAYKERLGLNKEFDPNEPDKK